MSTSSAEFHYLERWEFGTYEHYLRYQRDRARRTGGLTPPNAKHRKRLAEAVRRFLPQARSALCLGARHPSEVRHLRDMGFAAEGIDLFADSEIHTCDMSRVDIDPFLRHREFDLFFSFFALEHCWDFERFREQVLPRCRLGIAVAMPAEEAPKVDAWHCIAFEFQCPDATPAAFERAFPGFELVFREVVSGTLRFLLRRKEASACHAVGRPVSTKLRNVMVANYIADSKYSRDELIALLQAQVDNSLEVGWNPDEILLVTNFPFSFRGVTAVTLVLDDHCPRGSKMFAIEHLLRRETSDDLVFWAHDLDCWQNVWFDPPEFRDVGACEYSRPKFNGGSVFWRRCARDIADEVVRRLRDDRAPREEPTLNAVFREHRFCSRVSVLNSTYNVGCSGFKERLAGSIKPVHVSHFRPTNSFGWNTHVLNRHAYSDRSASLRLEALLRRWYPGLPSELRPSERESFR